MIELDKRIRTREQLNDWLAYETRHYPNSGKSRIYNLLLLSENAILRRHIMLLRKTEYYVNSGSRVLSKIYKMRLELFQIKYGMHIPINVFERGLHIVHLGEILVNQRARVGKNCALHIHTAIVAGGFNDDAPCLGDGALLFVGAVVSGDTHIADNVVIGANSVVSRDVTEENVTVAGSPAKVVAHKGRLDI